MTPFLLTSPLRTDRLVLRAHGRDDLEDLLRFHGDPEVVRYVPWPVRDREDTRAALEVKLGQDRIERAGQWLVLAVERRDDGRVVGEVLLQLASEADRQGQLGFVLARDAWGQGYAAEAAAEVLRLGFEDLGLHRITAVCLQQNAASAALLQRLGMQQEGRFVEDVWFKGAWGSRLLFALRAPDWRARRDEGAPPALGG